MEKVTKTSNGDIHFKWKNRAGKDAAYFAIYRLTTAKGKLLPEQQLITTIRNINQISTYTLKDPDTNSNKDIFFMTSLDRSHNESLPSNPLPDQQQRN